MSATATTVRALPGAATKRRAPAFRRGFVPRPRLVRRLLEAGAAPVAVLTAPAGYGKTTLLAEWDRRDERPFAWITLDEEDNDEAVLLAGLASALDGEGARRSRVVRRLERHAPFVLVLDDVHVLHAPEAVEVVRTLAHHMPPGSQLALASRRRPELPLGRLRAHRALVELGPPELAMAGSEAASLLSQAGLEPVAAEVDALVRLTEGWPAALYLAALSARDQPGSAGALSRFGGADTGVAEYVRDELLERMPPAEAAFLEHTSVLERLAAPVCDAVTASRGSARLLGELADAGVLVPLDRQGGEYRCHGLLRQALQRELRRLEPHAEAELHERASDFYAEHGEPERAIDHAIAARDLGRAGRLLQGRALEYVTRGENETVRRWLRRLGAEEISAHPALAVAAAYSGLADGALDTALRWEAAARRALHETPPRKRSEALALDVAVLRAAVARDGMARMGQDAAAARTRTAADGAAHAICLLLEGVAHHLGGDPEAARRVLEEGARRAGVTAPIVQTLCLAQLALLAAEREEWEEGAVHAARATAQLSAYGLADYPASALVFAASASVRAQRGRVTEAEHELRQATRLLSRLEDFVPWLEAEARIALARTALRLGDPAKARRLLDEAARHARRLTDAPRLGTWIGDVRGQIDALSAAAMGAPRVVTAAELRVLVVLPTHLSFREIADQLCVSANTVKTQAHAVYRKLGASSRSEAVTRATELGLLDSTPNG